jgi:hypothetical protein
VPSGDGTLVFGIDSLSNIARDPNRHAAGYGQNFIGRLSGLGILRDTPAFMVALSRPLQRHLRRRHGIALRLDHDLAARDALIWRDNADWLSLRVGGFYFRSGTFSRQAMVYLQGLGLHARNLLRSEVGMDFQQLADKALQGTIPEREV